MSELIAKAFEIYRGDGGSHQAQLEGLPAQPPTFAEHGKYLAQPDLAEAVNVAIISGQPLLVTGEPGCGKTKLAWSIAAELDLKGPEDKVAKPLVYQVRSTSKAQDVLYSYDAVLRFHDIQVGKQANTGKRSPERPRDYIRFEALGIAITEKRRRVVLIDEIDKAPRDFPNDLLHEIDQMKFSVPELEDTFEAEVRPIVVITSNSERQLPLPFLRRCVFHHIKFPERGDLRQIVEQRLGPLELDVKLLNAAIERFLQVRQVPGISKPPATGELISWLHLLAVRKVSVAKLENAPLRDLPLWQALIKSRDDLLALPTGA